MSLLLFPVVVAAQQPIRLPVPNPSPQSPKPTPQPTGETEEAEEAEPTEPEEVEPPEPGDDDQPEQNKPGSMRSNENNPLNPAGRSLDRLVNEGINADLWQDMKGDLPCLEATDSCISQLQILATTKNPLLVSIDQKVEEINTRIEEARKQNQRSVSLSVFTPAVQYIFSGTGATATTSTTVGNVTTTRQVRAPGPIDRILGIFTGITGINNLLSVVGVPLFQALTGSTPGVQQNNIALADLQVKTAALVKDRQVLANDIKNKVYSAVIEFDNAAREFQLSTEVARRETDRFQLINLEYRLGQHDTNSYLAATTSLDNRKASTFRAWASLRRHTSIVKLLVLGQED